MNRFLSLICVLALNLAVVSHCSAQVVPLVVDSTNSNLDLTLALANNQSPVSGTATVFLQNSFPPSGTAQLTALDLTLDDPLLFNLGLGLAGTTQANDVMVSLITPGAPGTISGGTFDQLGNELSLSGLVTVSDALGLFTGTTGDTVIDLSTLTLGPTTDLTNITVSQTGNVVTIGGQFDILQEDLGGFPIDLVGTGTFTASGIVTAIPEPGSLVVLVGMATALLTRRRR